MDARYRKPGLTALLIVCSLAGSALAEEQSPQVEQATLTRAIEALEVEAEQRQAFVVARGRTLVRLLRAGWLPLSGGFESMTEHASRVDRLRRAIEIDQKRLQQIESELAAKRKRAERLASFTPDQQADLARARSAIAAARERDEAFHRAFGAGRSSADSTAVYGGKIVGTARDGHSATTFGSRKGKLALPVAGRVEMSTRKSHAGGGRAALLTVAPGATVHAVAPGRVAFAGDYPELGQTVIIDHGSDYYCVYSSLSSASVRAGDELERGANVGRAGHSAGRGRVVVELRHRASAIDTPTWFGL